MTLEESVSDYDNGKDMEESITDQWKAFGRADYEKGRNVSAY